MRRKKKAAAIPIALVLSAAALTCMVKVKKRKK